MTEAEFEEYQVRWDAAEAALKPYSLKKIKAVIRSLSDGWVYLSEHNRKEIILCLLSDQYPQTLEEVMGGLEE
jgi:hypothetical protein